MTIKKNDINKKEKKEISKTNKNIKSKKIYMSPDQPKKKNIKKSTPRL